MVDRAEINKVRQEIADYSGLLGKRGHKDHTGYRATQVAFALSLSHLDSGLSPDDIALLFKGIDTTLKDNVGWFGGLSGSTLHKKLTSPSLASISYKEKNPIDDRFKELETLAQSQLLEAQNPALRSMINMLLVVLKSNLEFEKISKVIDCWVQTFNKLLVTDSEDNGDIFLEKIKILREFTQNESRKNYSKLLKPVEKSGFKHEKAKKDLHDRYKKVSDQRELLETRILELKKIYGIPHILILRLNFKLPQSLPRNHSFVDTDNAADNMLKDAEKKLSEVEQDLSKGLRLVVCGEETLRKVLTLVGEATFEEKEASFKGSVLGKIVEEAKNIEIEINTCQSDNVGIPELNENIIQAKNDELNKRLGLLRGNLEKFNGLKDKIASLIKEVEELKSKIELLIKSFSSDGSGSKNNPRIVSILNAHLERLDEIRKNIVSPVNGGTSEQTLVTLKGRLDLTVQQLSNIKEEVASVTTVSSKIEVLHTGLSESKRDIEKDEKDKEDKEIQSIKSACTKSLELIGLEYNKQFTQVAEVKEVKDTARAIKSMDETVDKLSKNHNVVRRAIELLPAAHAVVQQVEVCQANLNGLSEERHEYESELSKKTLSEIKENVVAIQVAHKKPSLTQDASQREKPLSEVEVRAIKSKNQKLRRSIADTMRAMGTLRNENSLANIIISGWRSLKNIFTSKPEDSKSPKASIGEPPPTEAEKYYLNQQINAGGTKYSLTANKPDWESLLSKITGQQSFDDPDSENKKNNYKVYFTYVVRKIFLEIESLTHDAEQKKLDIKGVDDIAFKTWSEQLQKIKELESKLITVISDVKNNYVMQGKRENTKKVTNSPWNFDPLLKQFAEKFRALQEGPMKKVNEDLQGIKTKKSVDMAAQQLRSSAAQRFGEVLAVCSDGSEYLRSAAISEEKDRQPQGSAGPVIGESAQASGPQRGGLSKIVSGKLGSIEDELEESDPLYAEFTALNASYLNLGNRDMIQLDLRVDLLGLKIKFSKMDKEYDIIKFKSATQSEFELIKKALNQCPLNLESITQLSTKIDQCSEALLKEYVGGVQVDFCNLVRTVSGKISNIKKMPRWERSKKEVDLFEKELKTLSDEYTRIDQSQLELSDKGEKFSVLLKKLTALDNKKSDFLVYSTNYEKLYADLSDSEKRKYDSSQKKLRESIKLIYPSLAALSEDKSITPELHEMIRQCLQDDDCHFISPLLYSAKTTAELDRLSGKKMEETEPEEWRKLRFSVMATKQAEHLMKQLSGVMIHRIKTLGITDAMKASPKFLYDIASIVVKDPQCPMESKVDLERLIKVYDERYKNKGEIVIAVFQFLTNRFNGQGVSYFQLFKNIFQKGSIGETTVLRNGRADFLRLLIPGLDFDYRVDDLSISGVNLDLDINQWLTDGLQKHRDLFEPLVSNLKDLGLIHIINEQCYANKAVALTKQEVDSGDIIGQTAPSEEIALELRKTVVRPFLLKEDYIRAVKFIRDNIPFEFKEGQRNAVRHEKIKDFLIRHLSDDALSTFPTVELLIEYVQVKLCLMLKTGDLLRGDGLLFLKAQAQCYENLSLGGPQSSSAPTSKLCQLINFSVEADKVQLTFRGGELAEESKETKQRPLSPATVEQQPKDERPPQGHQLQLQLPADQELKAVTAEELDQMQMEAETLKRHKAATKMEACAQEILEMMIFLRTELQVQQPKINQIVQHIMSAKQHTRDAHETLLQAQGQGDMKSEHVDQETFNTVTSGVFEMVKAALRYGAFATMGVPGAIAAEAIIANPSAAAGAVVSAVRT